MTHTKLTSPEAIEAQLKLENQSMLEGIAAYRESLAEDGLMAVSPGKQLLKAAMSPMVAALKSWLEATAEGLASRNAASFHFINGMDLEAVAWVTANVVLSRLHEQPKVVNAATQISMRLEQTVNLAAIAKAQPKLADKIVKRTERMEADKNRMVFIRKGAELVDVKLVNWDDGVRVRVGTLLIEMFAQHTGLIAVETQIRGRNTTAMSIRATESCLKWLDASHERCELLMPTRMPMVCMPRQWTNPFNGGYLTPELRQPIVKTRNRGYLTSLKEWDMPWVYASVNALQDTEWAVNEDILKVLQTLRENNSTTGGLPSSEDIPFPTKGWAEDETPDPAVLQAWKVDTAKTYEANAKVVSKRIQMFSKMRTAELMVEHGNRFHFVYNLDWRGRIYPVAPCLSPQGDDLSKSLLRFSRGVALGDEGAYWLAVHGANTFGVDKVSFEERIQWVQDNEDMILSCGRDGLADQSWADADSPFMFLAFCQEWAKLDAWVQAGLPQATFESSLATSWDGACNGLQNFSAMLRDPVGGKATGLVPGEKPSDIYSEVAAVAQLIIDKDAAADHEVAQRWVGKMSRKLAKRNTMTVPYGVTMRGMKDQMFGLLTDSDAKHRVADATYLAQCNSQAIGNVVVAARLAMDWLKEAAKVAASNQLPVRWTTPAGFLAVQDYREEVGERMNFEVLGRRYQLIVQKEGDKLNTRAQSMGISPNYVHSLDAAHAMRTILFCAADGMQDFAFIHDSFGSHAGHAAKLRDNLRQAFVEQYTPNVLEKFRNELLEQLPPELHSKLPELPPMGDLDLSQVNNSEYFFA